MHVLAEKEWDWQLFVDGERLVLVVLCGSVGLFTTAIELNAEDRALFERDGIAGLQHLIDSVRGAPENFQKRAVSPAPFS